MRKHLLLTVIIILSCACQEISLTIEKQNDVSLCSSYENLSDSYYWCDGVKVPLTVDSSKFFVIVENVKLNSLTRSVTDFHNHVRHIKLIDNYASVGITQLRGESSLNLTSFILDGTLQETFDIADAIYVAPYFKTEDGAEIGVTDIISVQLNEESDIADLDEIANTYNMKLLGQNEHDPSIYVLSCTKDTKGNAIEMANLIYELGIFDYVMPEFILESRTAANPNDSYFSSQWNLKNTMYPGIDVSYVDAITNYTFPYIDDIIVAVIDNGVYANHEDLSLCSESFDAHKGVSPSALYGSHGTAVAGVIGATTNNNKGISGVASGVKIMPVSICYTADGERLGISASTSTNFANAIRFAANNGAKIINNSWSFNTSSPISDINNAITYAHSKGSIVVFASGNDASEVSQPAAGAPSATLVVGAIKRDGYKASFSNYGSSLDIMAPGVGIWTLNDDGTYRSVDGTSVAAPHISGVAALIWARNPNLTASRVRDIIEQSVKKVGGNEYNGKPVRLNGSWNQFFGYGLINASAAVSAATGQPPVAPSIYTELTEISVNDLLSMELDDADAWDTIYLARNNRTIGVFIEDYDSSASYVWNSTLPPYSGFSSTFTVDGLLDIDEPELHEITCKVLKNGYSATSGISLVVVPYDYSY